MAARDTTMKLGQDPDQYFLRTCLLRDQVDNMGYHEFIPDGILQVYRYQAYDVPGSSL